MKYPELPKPEGYTWQLNQYGHNVREENDCFTESQMKEYGEACAAASIANLAIVLDVNSELSNTEPADPYLKTLFAELYAQDSRSIHPKWKPNEVADYLLLDLHSFLKLVYFAGRNSK